MTERLALPFRRHAPHGLWLGPAGVWDHGPMPGWRSAAHAPVVAVHHASFDHWCQAHPGRACALVVSGWWLHELVLDRQLPLADDSARLAYARQLLQHYHGEVAAQWPLAAWRAAGRRGVSALHAMPLLTLQASARQSGVRLHSVRPWWCLALALVQQRMLSFGQADSARLLVVDGAFTTQIDLSRGQLTGLVQRRLAAPHAGALQALCDDSPAGGCLALGHGLAGSAELPAAITALGPLDGAAPAALWRLPAHDLGLAA